MIRIISHIILSAVLGVSVVGMTVNQHYCDGELYSSALFSDPHNCCEGQDQDMSCDHQKKKDDCQDQQVVLKITDQYVPSSNDVQRETPSFDLFGILPVSQSVNNDDCLNDPSHTICISVNHSPPGHQRIHSLLQTFLL